MNFKAGGASRARSRGPVALEVGRLREPGTVWLHDLISGSDPTVRLVVAPSGSPAVEGIHLAESDTLDTAKRGDVVLGGGVTSPVRALEAACRRQATALVLYDDDVDGAVVQAAWETGVALLSARPRIPWPAVRRTMAGVFENLSEAGGSDDVNDLFELCEVFAHALGGPVAIEDADFSVVAYSSGHAGGDEYRQQAILQRRTVVDFIGSLITSGLMDRLRNTDDVIALEYGQLAPRSSPRLLTAIRSGSELLGVIWACEDSTPFPTEASSALTEFAVLAAPVLAKRRWHSRCAVIARDECSLTSLRGVGDHRPLLAAWNWPA